MQKIIITGCSLLFCIFIISTLYQQIFKKNIVEGACSECQIPEDIKTRINSIENRVNSLNKRIDNDYVLNVTASRYFEQSDANKNQIEPVMDGLNQYYCSLDPRPEIDGKTVECN